MVTAGSVDDGKSTLVGRLLFDSKALFEDQLAHVVDASRRHNGALDLAMVTDGLRAEREQGITIDVAYRYFSTPGRSFIVADTPGHVRYTRNMVTGASTASLALLLIDARHGVVRQTRRHALIASLLGVPHLVIAVNKMDLVDWDERVFQRVVDDVTAFSTKLEGTDVTFIPVSALHGDNVVERSPHMPWYDGGPLLYQLEHAHIASDRNLTDARLPVQWVTRPRDGGRRYAGQVAGGVWREGDEVVVLPSGARSRVAAVETYDGALDAAFPPMSISVSLEDELDVARGDLLCRPHNRPEVAREVEALICWMGSEPARAGVRCALKHTTRTTPCELVAVRHRIDVDTLHRDESAGELAINDVGRAVVRTSAPLAFDPYRRNRATGSFILIDEGTNDTVAAGMILGPAVVPGRARHGGATVWLTGLPAAGKSTLAEAVRRALVERGRAAHVLDGDDLRRGLCADLGFARADRDENVRRAAHVARLLADAGLVVLVALVSPYAEARAAARAIHADGGVPFVEAYLATPLDVCERRDPKGLYARARRGELAGMTGIDDPYEPPPDPELTIAPQPLEASVDAVLQILDAVR